MQVGLPADMGCQQAHNKCFSIPAFLMPRPENSRSTPKPAWDSWIADLGHAKRHKQLRAAPALVWRDGLTAQRKGVDQITHRLDVFDVVGRKRQSEFCLQQRVDAH